MAYSLIIGVRNWRYSSHNATQGEKLCAAPILFYEQRAQDELRSDYTAQKFQRKATK